MSNTFGKKSIFINSDYRTNKATSMTTDFIYTFPETVRNVVHTNLLTAVVENGVYNVVAGVNDTFQMNFINYNTPIPSAVYTSAGTQTMPGMVSGSSMTFEGTTTSGTLTLGSDVDICNNNGDIVARGNVLNIDSGAIMIGLTSLLNGGSVIDGFIINQYTEANASTTSTTSATWDTIGQSVNFDIVTSSFTVSTNTNVVVVNSYNKYIVGTASVVGVVGSTRLTLKISTVLKSATDLATWEIYQISGTPTQVDLVRTITVPAKYYDLESLVANIQDLINSSIPTQWNLPSPLTDTKFTAKVDSQGYFYLVNEDTRNWQIIFNQPGGQKLLGFSNLLVIPPAVLPFVGPSQLNHPYEVISPQPMVIYNYDVLLVQSDRLGNSITSSQGFDCWWVIPNVNSQNNSTTITYENPRHPLLETAWKVPRDLEFIDIRLLDKTGKVVDIGNNNVLLVVECFTDDSARR